MTTTWKADLTKLIQKEAKNLGMYPDSEVLNLVFKCVDTDSYYRITHELGKSYTELCMLYFLEVEDYETAAIIRDEVIKYNKQNGTNIILNV